MRWCTRCVLPDTRPNLEFDDDGVCSACRGHGRRPSIDWNARYAQFVNLVAEAKERNARYDCIIPVSGGKDSTWQVITSLEHGLRPLAVTWKTPARTEVGAGNLAYLVALGVDHVDFQVNPAIERRFMRKALARKGDPAIPMHMALFSIPMTIATWVGAPLVIWGENSAVEYGGDDHGAARDMDDAWLVRFGVTHGTSANDWADEEMPLSSMAAYIGPTAAELRARNVRPVFLGSYFAWDPEETLRVAESHGFRRNAGGARVGYWDYADIDDDFISVHHWLKWYKFGFTRLFDNLALEIRNGRMTREAAIDVIRARGDETPHGDIKLMCEFIGIEVDDFFAVTEPFRNVTIWQRHPEHGRWYLPGFIIDDWNW
ncbi:MAG: N-acetyl sugar amidotransferase [Acidimicrobiia bacterium]